MDMIYLLMIWTVVGVGDAKGTPTVIKYDWRPLGEFHMEEGRMGKRSAEAMCRDAAQQLGLNYDKYRCIRSK